MSLREHDCVKYLSEGIRARDMSEFIRFVKARRYQILKIIQSVVDSPKVEEINVLLCGNRLNLVALPLAVSSLIAGVLGLTVANMSPITLIGLAVVFVYSATVVMAVAGGTQTLSDYKKAKKRLTDGEIIVPDDYKVQHYCMIQGAYLAHKKLGLKDQFRKNFPRNKFPGIF